LIAEYDHAATCLILPDETTSFIAFGLRVNISSHAPGDVPEGATSEESYGKHDDIHNTPFTFYGPSAAQ
tara:strand:- start:192 stop:398 length:207 start_codon:yes stop_codon:yes gene_type:complete